MREGWTPFIEAKKYGNSIDSSSLWCKVEGQNPSGSFKDRAASLGLSLAVEWRKPGVFTASSGNAAAAISAYAARAGVRCLVLIREDSTPSKLGQVAMYGANLLRVKEIFRDQQTLARALDLTQKALPDWLNHFVWAPYNPLLIDGLKTIAYEIASDTLKSELPDYVFVPTAGGDLLYGIFKGFLELKEGGAVDKIPKMVVVQGLNSSPTVAAIESGSDKVPETESAETVAGALRVNFGTEHTLVAVRRSKGFGIAVSDGEIISAQRKIAATEGIFTEVSSATALAAIEKSIKEGRVEKDQKVIAILTGSGFKDYSPPFKDISLVPLAQSSDRIPDVLKSSYGF
jgi:threonine synthase